MSGSLPSSKGSNHSFFLALAIRSFVGDEKMEKEISGGARKKGLVKWVDGEEGSEELEIGKNGGRDLVGREEVAMDDCSEIVF